MSEGGYLIPEKYTPVIERWMAGEIVRQDMTVHLKTGNDGLTRRVGTTFRTWLANGSIEVTTEGQTE